MFVESISQRSEQNNHRSRGKEGNKDQADMLLVNTSLSWSTVNRTPHPVGGKEMQPRDYSCGSEGLQQERHT